ncbi:Phosphorylated carbohydrates phosphatase [Hartmannibacter diazotrophicus]|uniref:Phosphorylated carbohydrates phosphatase n=1 Tax=Hartmannibacter diazotrophicus TaxID=1482074 RepID=A0A2C9DCQ8_9HYPH|nr:HAD-IA family hydrolase [Hartmannibacter diazotrophicus]SON57395.1 Phosphorylated carbohydrates phosphatase [Hartmannibacter diazotrophicus]
MTLRALIFDVDGTLAETEEAHRLAFNETFAAASLGWHWTVADYRRLLATTGGKERMRRHRDDIGAREPCDETIADLHQRKTIRYADILHGGGLTLRPGVQDLVAAARDGGLKLAVATTTSRPNVDALCRACWGLLSDQVFDVVAAGDEVSAKKPAPDVFLLALERLGLAASEAIAFEDSLNGLRSAKAAGLRVIVTPSIYTCGEDFSAADRLLPDLAALPAPDLLRLWT